MDPPTALPRPARRRPPDLREPAKRERDEAREVFRKVVDISSISGTMATPGRRTIQLGIPDQMRQMASILIPLGRPATPEEAPGGVFLLCSPWSNYVHGQVLNVTGGQFTGMTT